MATETIFPPLRTSAGGIVDAAGRPVRLLAVNWYGAESEDHVVGGLQAQPLAAIVRQIRATWGGPAATDWRAAAGRGGDAVLSGDPDLLVIVEGVQYAADLSGAAQLPVELGVPNRVVYSAHDYVWFEPGVTSAEEWHAEVRPRWAYLMEEPDPQPLWVSEF